MIVVRRVNEVRLYIKIVLEDDAVAMSGRCGCGLDSQSRVGESGCKVESRLREGTAAVGEEAMDVEVTGEFAHVENSS